MRSANFLENARVAGETGGEVFQGHRSLGRPVQAPVELGEPFLDFGDALELIDQLSHFLDRVGKSLFVGFVECEPELRPPELGVLRRRSLTQIAGQVVSIALGENGILLGE